MQNRLSEGNLLNEKGELEQAGYATSLIKRYDRNNIKVSKLKIKEWDYYLVYNGNVAIALTVADNGYMGMLSASVINFKTKKEKTSSIIEMFTKGKYNLPASSRRGDILVKTNQAEFKFLHEKEKRHLVVEYKNFDDRKNLSVDITLSEEPKDSMVIATPFKDKPKAFYYNQKIIGFKATGVVKYGDETILLGEDALGLLDWGRGVWTYKNTWYWGAITGVVNGKIFGINMGYGFGDTSNASENMAFYDGGSTKLDQIEFVIPKTKKGKYDYLMPWKITSNDGAVDMTFAPILNRHSDTNLLVLRSNQNQVFGKFTGTVKLKSGEVLNIKEMIGFAECVYNKW